MMNPDSGSHQDLYKHTGSNETFSLSSLRQAVGSSVRQEQSRLRHNVFCQRRFKVKTAHFEEEFCASEVEEEELVRNNVKLLKQGKRTQALKSLSSAFARLAKNADSFLRCDGLQSLLSCFGSSNVEVLQAAAWCTVNLTAGVSFSEPLPSVASTLLQFLHSSDPLMQELCAWALGNLAGDSFSNAVVLQSQGCAHALMELISSNHHLSYQPLSESVLFALINMAASSFQCIEDIQNKQMFEFVKMMFETIDANSSLTFQLAWLTNTIYSREETFARYPEQYPRICHLVSKRLSKLCCLDNRREYQRLVLPLIHCLANMIAMDTDLAKIAVERNPSVLSSLTFLLMSKSEILVQETLRTLVNCSASVACRVLFCFHPKLCLAIMSLCHHTKAGLVLQALTVMDSMARTSSFVDRHLIGQGVIAKLVLLLRPGNENPTAVTEAALLVIRNLLPSCPEAHEELTRQQVYLPLPTDTQD